MKVSKLLLSLLILPSLMHGQEIQDLLTYEIRDMDKFMKSTTYAVLDQFKESPYSLALISAMKNNWTLTPFEVIDQITYNEYRKDKTKSFLSREQIAGDDQLISLNLFMGGQKGMDKKGIILATIQLKHYTATDEQFLYKLPTYVKNIQWQITMIKEQGIRGPESYETYYEKQRAGIHSKTLYILSEHLNSTIDTFKKLQKYYRYAVTLVEPTQIEEAIQKKDSTIAYLSIVAPTKNWGGQNGYYKIFTTNTGECLESYIRPVSNRAPLGVTGYDLNRLSKD